MSLKLVSNRDMFAYLELGNFQDPALSNGIEFHPGAQFRPNQVYLDRYAIFQGGWNEGGVDHRTVRFDPELVTTSGSLVGTWSDQAPTLMGDFEPITGSQRMFSHDNGTPAPFREIEYGTPNLTIDSDPYPMLDWNRPSAASGIVSPNDGYWELETSNNSQNAVFFPGENRVLINRGKVRADGGTWYEDVMVSVALDTGYGTPLDIPVLFSTTPTKYQDGPLFGTSTVLGNYIQFVPDADSLNIAPKGRLFLNMIAKLSGSGEFYFYVKMVEWNPTAAAGSPTRDHMREVLSSRCVADIPASGTTVLGIPPGRVRVGNAFAVDAEHFLFDNSRGRFVLYSSVTDANGNARTGCHSIIEFSETAELIHLRTPSSLAEPSTGRVVVFSTDCRGDLGEIIGGKVVTWDLDATSTEGEVIDVTGDTGGELEVVANQPVELTSPYPRAVYKDGTPLTEGADYDWVTTGIQFIGPEPIDGGPVYTADYSHPTVPVKPAHGTLLSSTSISDSDGVAQIRVRYEADPTLAGTRDRITADADA